MALTVTGDQVEAILRERLLEDGFTLRNVPRRRGETGADILADRGGVLTAVECIGFQGSRRGCQADVGVKSSFFNYSSAKVEAGVGLSRASAG